ncbi:60 kDa chaperonin [Striga asiatica]|uniref:60 kDa chaperonin n=1 Tax=Striga asiatica TaxID=4170 RepID=A0A5A7RKK1_STRAF|nr:60 kDa chaperonin [Striga asiatica]
MAARRSNLGIYEKINFPLGISIQESYQIKDSLSNLTQSRYRQLESYPWQKSPDGFLLSTSKVECRQLCQHAQEFVRPPHTVAHQWTLDDRYGKKFSNEKNSTLGMPKKQTLTSFILYRKEIKILTNSTLVPPFVLLLEVEISFNVFRTLPYGTIYSLQHWFM